MYKPLRYLAAGSAYLAPPLLLVSGSLLIQFISEPGSLVQCIALTVFIPALSAAGALFFPLAQGCASRG